MFASTPKFCLEPKPTTQSVQFAGVHINLTHLAAKIGMTQAYMSQLFLGHREPSLGTARAIASALGMNIGDFLVEIEGLKSQIPANSEKVVEKSNLGIARNTTSQVT